MRSDWRISLPHVEAVAARIGAAPARGAQRPVPGDRGDQPLDAPVLVGRHLGEVLVAQQLVAGGAELERIAHLVVRLAAGRVRERLADLLLRERALGGAHRRQHGRAQEPGVERTVEEVELVVARDERLAEREVDVLLAGQVDGGDATQRVGDAARADLEPDLAQDAAEGDDVADDGVGHAALPTAPLSRGRCRRAARASRRARPRCPRGT